MPITNVRSIEGILLHMAQSLNASHFPGYATQAYTMLLHSDATRTRHLWRQHVLRHGPDSFIGMNYANWYEASKILAPVTRLVLPVLCSVLGNGAKPQISAAAPTRSFASLLHQAGLRPHTTLRMQRDHQPNVCVWHPGFRAVLATAAMGALAGTLAAWAPIASYAIFALVGTWVSTGSVVGTGALIAANAATTLQAWVGLGMSLSAIGAASICLGQRQGNDELSRYGEELSGFVALSPIIVMGGYVAILTGIFMKSELAAPILE